MRHQMLTGLFVELPPDKVLRVRQKLRVLSGVFLASVFPCDKTSRGLEQCFSILSPRVVRKNLARGLRY